MVDSLPGHAPLNIGNMIGQLCGKGAHALNGLVRVEVSLLCHPTPVTLRDVTEAVLAAEFHGEFHLLDVHMVIWSETGEIVKWCETDTAASAYGRVLRVRVGADDQPVECEGLTESRYILCRICRSKFSAVRLYP